MRVSALSASFRRERHGLTGWIVRAQRLIGEIVLPGRLGYPVVSLSEIELRDR